MPILNWLTYLARDISQCFQRTLKTWCNGSWNQRTIPDFQLWEVTREKRPPSSSSLSIRIKASLIMSRWQSKMIVLSTASPTTSIQTNLRNGADAESYAQSRRTSIRTLGMQLLIHNASNTGSNSFIFVTWFLTSQPCSSAIPRRFCLEETIRGWFSAVSDSKSTAISRWHIAESRWTLWNPRRKATIPTDSLQNEQGVTLAYSADQRGLQNDFTSKVSKRKLYFRCEISTYWFEPGEAILFWS